MTLKTNKNISRRHFLKQAGTGLFGFTVSSTILGCLEDEKNSKNLENSLKNFGNKVRMAINNPSEKTKETQFYRAIKTPEDLSFLDIKKEDFKDEKSVYFLEKEYDNCHIPGGNNLMRDINMEYLTEKEIEKRDLKNRYITKNPSPCISYSTKFYPEGIPIRKKPSLRGWLDSKVCSSLDLNIKYDNNIECSYSIGTMLNTKELKKDMEIFKRIVVNHMKRNNLKLPEEIIDSYKNPVNLKKYADEPDEVKTFEKEIIYNMLSIAKEFN